MSCEDEIIGAPLCCPTLDSVTTPNELSLDSITNAPDEDNETITEYFFLSQDGFPITTQLGCYIMTEDYA